jgi:transcriptional regulator with XRE-family HTH domain
MTRNGTRQVRPPITPYELRLARIIAGLRINDIAAYTGISTPTLSLVERGKLPLTPKREKAIRAALGHATPRPGGGPRVRARS